MTNVLYEAFVFIFSGGSGEIKCFEDIEKFKQATGCSSVMLARAAEWNPSIFRREGFVATDDLVRSYLRYAVDFENDDTNCKYCIQQLIKDQLTTPRGEAFVKAGLLREFWFVTDCSLSKFLLFCFSTWSFIFIILVKFLKCLPTLIR